MEIMWVRPRTLIDTHMMAHNQPNGHMPTTFAQRAIFSIGVSPPAISVACTSVFLKRTCGKRSGNADQNPRRPLRCTAQNLSCRHRPACTSRSSGPDYAGVDSRGHGPDGPILDITGVRFEVDGKTLAWHRDSVNTYEYHLEVPAGASMLHAHLDCIYSKATRTTATLEWESLLLYPAHVPVREIAIQPTVTVPAHWGIGTSLKPLTPYDPEHPAGGTVQYAATTVEMLEDSPIMAGLYFHEYPLAPGVSPQHFYGCDRTYASIHRG